MNANSKQFLIDTAKQAMEHYVLDGGGFPPTLVAEYRNDTVNVMVLDVSGHPFDVILGSAKQLITGKLRSVSLTCDTYMLKGKLDDLPGSIGNLAPRFAAGDPAVTEALTIVIAVLNEDGGVDEANVNLPYVHDREAHTLVWGEQMGGDEDITHTGRMNALMASLVLASQVL